MPGRKFQCGKWAHSTDVIPADGGEVQMDQFPYGKPPKPAEFAALFP